MANQLVTDLGPITTLPDSGIIHVVDVTNNSQNVAGTSFKITKENFLKENTAAILLNTVKVGITPAQATAITNNTVKVGITTGQASAIVTNTAKVGYTEAAVTANVTVAANTTAVDTKLGKSTSTIAVSEVDVLTAAAYVALSTKVATKLYFTT